MKKLSVFCLLSFSVLAAEKTQVPSLLRPTKNPQIRNQISGQSHGNSPWYLGSFLELADQDPKRLFEIGLGLYRASRIKNAREKNQYAYDWQHRLAFISAVSQVFDPKNSQKHGPKVKAKARKFIEYSMRHDPALIVRDAAVESVRRLVRMNPEQSRLFKGSLERAFFDKKNVIDGEGLFIRETILTALREASLPLSAQVKRAALSDRNEQVRALVSAWDTRAFQKL